MLGGGAGELADRRRRWPWRDDRRVVRLMRVEAPPPIRPTRPRWHAGKVGADGASPSKVFDRRLRAAFVGILEGRPPCRPIFAGRRPASSQPTRPRCHAGKVGADGASPSKVFDRRFRAAFVGILEGRPLCRPIFARLSLAPFLKNPPCAGARENNGPHGGRPSSWGWLGSYAVGEFRNWRMANSAAAAASGTRWCCMAKPWGIFWPM